MTYIYQYAVCLAVIFFVGLSLRIKPWISALGATSGAVGYLVYLLCPAPKLGFLLSALVLTLLSETLARICKMPASIFLIMGIYPLVPGIALFQTVTYAIAGDYAQSLKLGGDALVCIALMAVAIAFVSVSFRILFGSGIKLTRKRIKSA